MPNQYRTAIVQRHARRRRLQVQYENHIIRLRCLYKVMYTLVHVDLVIKIIEWSVSDDNKE